MTLTGGASAEEALATLAVNAIPAVLTSDPGLYTLSDLPPVHCWTSLGLMPATTRRTTTSDDDLPTCIDESGADGVVRRDAWRACATLPGASHRVASCPHAWEASGLRPSGQSAETVVDRALELPEDAPATVGSANGRIWVRISPVTRLRRVQPVVGVGQAGPGQAAGAAAGRAPPRW